MEHYAFAGLVQSWLLLRLGLRSASVAVVLSLGFEIGAFFVCGAPPPLCQKNSRCCFRQFLILVLFLGLGAQKCALSSAADDAIPPSVVQ